MTKSQSGWLIVASLITFLCVVPFTGQGGTDDPSQDWFYDLIQIIAVVVAVGSIAAFAVGCKRFAQGE